MRNRERSIYSINNISDNKLYTFITRFLYRVNEGICILDRYYKQYCLQQLLPMLVVETARRVTAQCREFHRPWVWQQWMSLSPVSRHPRTQFWPWHPVERVTLIRTWRHSGWVVRTTPFYRFGLIITLPQKRRFLWNLSILNNLRIAEILNDSKLCNITLL